MIFFTPILFIVAGQSTPPPCPAYMSATECMICQDLYVQMGIPYDECPCNTAETLLSVNNEEGACCFSNTCLDVDCEEQCLALPGGVFYAGEDCSSSFISCISDPNYYGTCCITGSVAGFEFDYCVPDTFNEPCDDAGGTHDFGAGFQCGGSFCPGVVNVPGVYAGFCCYVDQYGQEIKECIYMNNINDATATSIENPICTALGGSWVYGYNGGSDDCITHQNTYDCNVDDCPEDDDLAACCLNDNCTEQTQNDCLLTSGTWHQGDTCSTFDCEDEDEDNQGEQGACCVGDTCIEVYFSTCASYPGGLFYGQGSNCNIIECDDDGIDDEQGACCINYNCSLITADLCASSGGSFLGLGTTCVGNPCDDGGDSTIGACCMSDSSCVTMTMVACLDGGGLWDGGTCSFTTCNAYDSKLCECLLLQAILDNNRKIHLELLDQGYTLDQSLLVQRLIEENTKTTNGLIAMQTVLLDKLVNEQMEEVVQLLTPVDSDPIFDNQDIDLSDNLAAFTNTVESNKNTLANMFTNPDQLGLEEYDFDEPSTAPTFTLNHGTFSPTLLGYTPSISQDYSFDFQLLEDWGIRPIIYAVILMIVGFWGTRMIWDETRKH